jgi:CRISPR-associated endonuclease/helicase Cas3
MGEQEQFTEWFARATGHAPYTYQRALAEAVTPPSVLELPTGSGKTQAVVGSWLFNRQLGVGPRRLVYALPMRTLAEQTAEVANEMRERLGISGDELPIHILMGGAEPPTEDWRLRPEHDQILIGTVDMLLSRALNRGYAESRFAWPVSFGLLSADCRWIFDEVQLMGPARATSAQLDGLRTSLGTALPCETVWVSATVDRAALQTIDRPEIGQVLTLPDEDRQGALKGRLEASKKLERVDASDASPSALLPKEIAQLTLTRHVAGTRTLIVVNRVELAQKIFEAVSKDLKQQEGPDVVLLHSRFRRPDRDHHMSALARQPGSQGVVAIATQVVEAGVDISSRTLITETAPFSSIVQRLGRCNRAGEQDEATVIWLDRGPVADDAAGRKLAAPYRVDDVESARAALLDLEGASLSPTRLEAVRVDEATEDPTVLRRRDLLDLFDTSPDLSGTDIDIAPFIREDDERTVTVFFRTLGTDPTVRIAGRPKPDCDEIHQPMPARNEVVQIPRATLEKRQCWRLDHQEGEWVRTSARDVPPGSTAMLAAEDGGYTPELGWQPQVSTPVTPVEPPVAVSVEGLRSDELCSGHEPEELPDHLQAVATEVRAIGGSLELDSWVEALHAAAALHDIGKAHGCFQGLMRSLIDEQTYPEKEYQLWAKSGKRGGGYQRPFFRHELASALALLGADGAIEVQDRSLVAYLIGAHHGKVRLSIRPAPGEQSPKDVKAGTRFALGVADGDRLGPVETPIGTLPAVGLDLELMELGAEDSWTRMAVDLRDRPGLGPFRLGFLEGILRVADWRASRA